MTDNLENENKLPISSGIGISSSTMRYVQEAADKMARSNEMIKKWLEQPLKDLAKLAEAKKMQEEAMKKALEIIPKIDLGWIQDAANESWALRALPTYSLQHTAPLAHDDEAIAPVSEKSKLDEMILALNRLADVQAEANQLQKEILKKQTKNKKKADLQILVLDEDGHLFLQAHPKASLDLSKSPIRKQILSNLKTEYISTNDLGRLLGSSESNTRKNIGNLNQIISERLKLKRPLIKNTPRVGYRLDPTYNFINHLK